jgi:uncharacterized coiled-coil DUF342 family protein
MPRHMRFMMDEGQEGLIQYGRLMQTIKKIMQKNNILYEQLNEYQVNIRKLNLQSDLTGDNIHSLNAGSADTAATIQRIEKSKNRINDLMDGMFKEQR